VVGNSEVTTLLVMLLTPHPQLGPFQINCPLGAGGMGEVYRASDTKLLASLNHPNIASIHGL